MRIALFALGAIAAVILGGLQAIAAIALRANAAPGSLPYFAPSVLTRAVAALEPSALLPQELRRVLAATALANGNAALAERFANTLVRGPDRLDLQARIEEARGERDAAIVDFLAAGDLASIEARVDALVARDDVAAAQNLQSHAIEALRATRAQNDTLAEAFYRDALLQQARAYEMPLGSRARTSLGYESAQSYRLATVYAPLELRYAIALGNQYLNIAQYALARKTFEHIAELDPANIEALTGLADEAIRRRDFADARAFLARARTLSPDSSDVARMAARIPAE
jgi:tetratricopeptide (TPR) repeat protein